MAEISTERLIERAKSRIRNRTVERSTERSVERQLPKHGFEGEYSQEPETRYQRLSIARALSPLDLATPNTRKPPQTRARDPLKTKAESRNAGNDRSVSSIVGAKDSEPLLQENIGHEQQPHSPVELAKWSCSKHSDSHSPAFIDFNRPPSLENIKLTNITNRYDLQADGFYVGLLPDISDWNMRTLLHRLQTTEIDRLFPH